ncbi:MAG: lipid-A-disaccharide synthase, partial [Bacteroidetes bacterium]
MKYYIIAGEASGDLHGSWLVRGLHRADADAAVRGWGGDLMERAGMQLDVHYRDTAFMGFVEVLRNLPTILRLMAKCKRDILAFRPDALILIDYPGFNLRMARWARARGIKVFYYISPQVWAWKEGRVETIRRAVDRMFVILPFEPAFYARHGIEVSYFGHPLVDEVTDFLGRHAPDRAAFAERHGLRADAPLVALLPGSRRQEISRSLEVMLEVARRQPHRQFVIAGAPSMDPAFYAPFVERATAGNLRMVHDQTWPLLAVADAALVTSGTATLETAMFGVP